MPLKFPYVHIHGLVMVDRTLRPCPGHRKKVHSSPLEIFCYSTRKEVRGCIGPGLAIPQGGPYERPEADGSSGYQEFISL